MYTKTHTHTAEVAFWHTISLETETWVVLISVVIAIRK